MSNSKRDLAREADRAFTSPTDLTTRRGLGGFTKRSWSPKNTNAVDASGSVAHSRRSVSKIDTSDTADLFDQMNEANSVRIKKKKKPGDDESATSEASPYPVEVFMRGVNAAALTLMRSMSPGTGNGDDDDGGGEGGGDDNDDHDFWGFAAAAANVRTPSTNTIAAESNYPFSYGADSASTSQRTPLDLHRNDNSFHVLANLLVEFIQAKLTQDGNTIILQPEDRVRMERVLPESVRLDFIDAVRHRLANTPKEPSNPLEFITLQCQELGMDREGRLNPILVAANLQDEPSFIPVTSVLAIASGSQETHSFPHEAEEELSHSFSPTNNNTNQQNVNNVNGIQKESSSDESFDLVEYPEPQQTEDGGDSVVVTSPTSQQQQQLSPRLSIVDTQETNDDTDEGVETTESQYLLDQNPTLSSIGSYCAGTAPPKLQIHAINDDDDDEDEEEEDIICAQAFTDPLSAVSPRNQDLAERLRKHRELVTRIHQRRNVADWFQEDDEKKKKAKAKAKVSADRIIRQQLQLSPPGSKHSEKGILSSPGGGAATPNAEERFSEKERQVENWFKQRKEQAQQEEQHEREKKLQQQDLLLEQQQQQQQQKMKKDPTPTAQAQQDLRPRKKEDPIPTLESPKQDDLASLQARKEQEVHAWFEKREQQSISGSTHKSQDAPSTHEEKRRQDEETVKSLQSARERGRPQPEATGTSGTGGDNIGSRRGRGVLIIQTTATADTNREPAMEEKEATLPLSSSPEPNNVLPPTASLDETSSRKAAKERGPPQPDRVRTPPPPPLQQQDETKSQKSATKQRNSSSSPPPPSPPPQSEGPKVAAGDREALIFQTTRMEKEVPVKEVPPPATDNSSSVPTSKLQESAKEEGNVAEPISPKKRPPQESFDDDKVDDLNMSSPKKKKPETEKELFQEMPMSQSQALSPKSDTNVDSFSRLRATRSPPPDIVYLNNHQEQLTESAERHSISLTGVTTGVVDTRQLGQSDMNLEQRPPTPPQFPSTPEDKQTPRLFTINPFSALATVANPFAVGGELGSPTDISVQLEEQNIDIATRAQESPSMSMSVISGFLSAKATDRLSVEPEALARQQLMAELREAANLLEESENPETTKFWQDHVDELQNRLRVLNGEEPSGEVTNSQAILDSNRRLVSEFEHREMYLPREPTPSTTSSAKEESPAPTPSSQEEQNSHVPTPSSQQHAASSSQYQEHHSSVGNQEAPPPTEAGPPSISSQVTPSVFCGDCFSLSAPALPQNALWTRAPESSPFLLPPCVVNVSVANKSPAAIEVYIPPRVPDKSPEPALPSTPQNSNPSMVQPATSLVKVQPEMPTVTNLHTDRFPSKVPSMETELTHDRSEPMHEEPPLVDVVAPADLPGGYHFEAELEGKRFLATVPQGGVTQGETFSCYMLELDSVAIDIPVGYWKDNLSDICDFGCCHSVIWNAFFCPLVALWQIQTRVGFDFLGRPLQANNGVPGQNLTNRAILLSVLLAWLFLNAAMYAAYNWKWSRGLDLSLADIGAICVVNVAMWCFIVFVTQSTRSSLREKFMIRESCCRDLDDICCASLCLPCTVGQMARHTANYDDYEAVCCSKTGLPDGVRVNQQLSKDGYMV